LCGWAAASTRKEMFSDRLCKAWCRNEINCAIRKGRNRKATWGRCGSSVGGSNDISKQNSQEALRQLSKFVKKCQDVNVIVMSAPHRHDLMPSSSVNSEVIRFNRLLRKRMKLYTKTKILDTDLKRDCFTKHGQHMNSLGKDQLIMKLAGMIASVTVKNSGSNIELKWKENRINLGNMEINQIPRVGGEIQLSKYEEGEVSKPQLNKRQRKNPALKDQDFLWQI